LADDTGILPTEWAEMTCRSTVTGIG